MTSDEDQPGDDPPDEDEVPPPTIIKIEDSAELGSPYRRRYSGPKYETLRKNLANLVIEGVVPDRAPEFAGDLLKLEIVRSRVQPHVEDSDAAIGGALVEVLNDAVEQIGSRKDRRVLRFVLPLRSEYVGTSARERRIAAGENIKDGKKVVKWGTIRAHHEPKALARLAKVLVAMEADHRHEESPTGGAEEV